MQIRNPAKGFLLSPEEKTGHPPQSDGRDVPLRRSGEKSGQNRHLRFFPFQKIKTRERAYGRASGARTAKGKKAGKRRIFRPFARLLPCRLFPFHNGNTPLPFRRFSSPGQSVPFSCIGRQ